MSYTFKLYSDKGDLIHSVEFTKEEFYVPSKKLCELDDLKYGDVIESLDYGINIFLPYDNGENFIVQNLSSIFKSLIPDGVDFEEVKGQSFYSFPAFIKLGLGDIVKNVYKTGIEEQYEVTALLDDNLWYKLDYVFLKSNDKVFFLVKNVTNYEILSTQEKEVFDNFHDVVFIVQDGKIVRANSAYVKVINKSKKELIGSKYNFDTFKFNYFYPVQWKKSFYKVLNKEILFYNFIGQLTDSKGSIHYFDVYAFYVNFNNKPAVQISSTDITKEKKAEYNALVFKKALDIVQSISKIAIMYWDPINRFQWTDEIYSILNMDKNEFSNGYVFNNLLNSDDKWIFEKQLAIAKGKLDLVDFDSMESVDLNSPYEIHSFEKVLEINVNNTIKYIMVYCQFFFVFDSEELNAVAFAQDVTDPYNKNFALQTALNKIKKSDEDKAVLIKEVHHRVKNNLQIIISLLNLDLRFHPDNPLATVEATRSRINAMALIHEKIYGSSDLDHINLKDYIVSEINSLISLYSVSNISTSFDLDDSIEVNVEKSIPIGLIINEVFTNVIKYAFPNDEKGNVSIGLKKSEDEQNIILNISDDGIGLPEGFNIGSTDSLGLVIIKNLIEQLNGELAILDQEGTAYEFVFPLF